MAEIDPAKFRFALRAWCKEKKITQYAIAEKIGIPTPSMYAYTKRYRVKAYITPRLDRAVKIAEALGITIDELARGPHGEGLRDE